MFRTSFPIGRVFGVDLRVHGSLPPLLLLAMVYSLAVTGNFTRGLGLCFALGLGIAIREAARSLAAAWNGLHLRALLIFPVGSIMAFASSENLTPASTRLIAIVTPISNLFAGCLLLGLSYGLDPRIQFFAQPWISAEHILRSIIWTEFVLAAVSALPIAPFSSRMITLPRGKDKGEGQAAEKTVASINFGSIAGIAAIIAGIAAMHLWLVLFGGFLLLMSRLLGSQAPNPAAAGDLIVRNAMESDFGVLSSSETLQSALNRTLSSTQETFPVTRGDRLVGSVARDTLNAKMRVEGDGYLQGLMTRSVPIAAPDEPLGDALRRSAAAGLGELIAVADGRRLVGILTPQGVRRAMQRAQIMKLTARKDTDRE